MFDELAKKIEALRHEYLFGDEAPADDCPMSQLYWVQVTNKLAEAAVLAQMGALIHAREITDAAKAQK